MSGKKGSKQHFVVDGRKVCPQCLEDKLVSEYYKTKSRGVSTIMSWCKSCCKRLRPQKSEYFKSYYQKNKENRKSQDRKRRYKVTQEMFDFVFDKQGHKCAICPTTDPGKSGWHTEHDHVSGRFRGVCCTHCNRMLGAARDSLSNLAKAIVYLESEVDIKIL